MFTGIITDIGTVRAVQKAGDTRFEIATAVAGAVLGIKQPHVSLLMRNRSGAFSIERLMEFLTVLGLDVEIRLKKTKRAQGQMSVVAVSA